LPSSSPSKEPKGCVDDPLEWYDSDGPKYDCEWYGSKFYYCKLYGDYYENFGKTANEACCVCGGGDRGEDDDDNDDDDDEIWEEISEDTFESGGGNFRGPRRGFPYNKFSNGDGSKCARLRKKQNIRSKFLVDVSAYTELKVNFWFFGKNLEPTDKFVLEYWMIGSWGWTVAKEYIPNIDGFNLNEWIESTVTFETTGSRAMFRFRAVSNRNDDTVFIDDIVISGLLEDESGSVDSAVAPEKPLDEKEDTTIGIGAVSQKSPFWQ